MVQMATPRTRKARPMSRAKGDPSLLRTAGPGGTRNQLGDGCSSQQGEEPDGDELQRRKRPFHLKQQSEHNQTKAEVIRLGQRVQAAERVRKPQQPYRPRQEKEGTGR